MTLQEERRFVEKVKAACCVDLLDAAEIEIDEFLFVWSANEKPHIQNDTFTINYRYANDHLVKLSVSHALAQSTKLSVYEYRVVAIVDETKDLPEVLALTGKVVLTRKAVAQLMGQVFLQKSAVNLLSSVLDTPDFFWESDVPDSLQHLYEGCCSYLEYENRVEVLNQRFGVLQEMLDMLRDHLHADHSRYDACESQSWARIQCRRMPGHPVTQSLTHALARPQSARMDRDHLDRGRDRHRCAPTARSLVSIKTVAVGSCGSNIVIHFNEREILISTVSTTRDVLTLTRMTDGPAPAKRCRIPFTVTGDSLEGKLRVFGRHARHPHRGVILCHPLSSLGGSMNDAIVSELWRSSQASRAFGAVLAYNQRGVGSSTGNSFGSLVAKLARRVGPQGDSAEKDATDVLRAIEFLVGVIEEEVGTTKPVEVTLVGYSYGAALAAQAVDHPSVTTFVGISPPIGNLASFFLPSKEHFRRLLRIKASDGRRRLVVIGALDQYTTEKQLVDFVLLNALDGDVELSVEQHQETQDDTALVRRRLALKDGTQERLLLEVYARNDHFWGNDAAAMVERCLAFASK